MLSRRAVSFVKPKALTCATASLTAAKALATSDPSANCAL
jgi:hypothetical protein